MRRLRSKLEDDAADPKRIPHHSSLDLRLIMKGPAGLLAIPARRLGRLAKIGLAQRHASRSGAKDHRQIAVRLQLGLLRSFMGCQQQHGAGAVEAGNLARTQVRRREGHRQVHFCGSLYALAADIEKRHGPERPASGAEALGVGLPADSQSRDNARASDDDARGRGERR